MSNVVGIIGGVIPDVDAAAEGLPDEDAQPLELAQQTLLPGPGLFRQLSDVIGVQGGGVHETPGDFGALHL